MVRSPRRTAFTLIELLVVVAIIALLISILLPSLSQAREQARTVKCAANQKQMGFANSMYADESDNWYVPLYVVSPYQDRWWMNPLFNDVLGINAGGDGVGINEGSHWPDGMLCPSAPIDKIRNNSHYPHQNNPMAGMAISSVYGMNRTGVFASDGKMAIRRTGVEAPAGTFQLADATGWRFHHALANPNIYWDIYGDWDSGSPWHYGAYRHNEGMNIQHFDGHVSYYGKSEAYGPWGGPRGRAQWYVPYD